MEIFQCYKCGVKIMKNEAVADYTQILNDEELELMEKRRLIK